MGKKIGKKLAIASAAYLTYVIGTSIVYPKYKMRKMACKKEKNLERVELPIEETSERVTVQSDCKEAIALRCEMIDHAKESIDFTQYSIFDDDSGDVFIQHLLRAADRGVKVRLILPRMIMKWKGKSAFKKNAVASHPNITLRLWGGVDLLRPWKMNNVLHDKIFIVDKQSFISAGRNVGNRFMFAKTPDEQAYDLDLIVDSSTGNAPLLQSVQQYFDDLWNSQNVKEVTGKSEQGQKDRAKVFQNENELNEKYSQYVGQSIWSDLPFVSIERCGFIHNPLNEIVKTPFIWEQLTTLVKQANKVRLQTPYLVLTNEMKSYMQNWSSQKVMLLTNSLASTPNIMAFSGYLSQKAKDLKMMTIQEFQGRGSVHNKAFVVDDSVVGVGSFNIDPRSAYFNTENMVVVQSKPLAQQMNKIMDHFEAESLRCQTENQYAPKEGIHPRCVLASKRLFVRIVGILTKGIRHLT